MMAREQESRTEGTEAQPDVQHGGKEVEVADRAATHNQEQEENSLRQVTTTQCTVC